MNNSMNCSTTASKPNTNSSPREQSKFPSQFLTLYLWLYPVEATLAIATSWLQWGQWLHWVLSLALTISTGFVLYSLYRVRPQGAWLLWLIASYYVIGALLGAGSMLQVSNLMEQGDPILLQEFSQWLSPKLFLLNLVQIILGVAALHQRYTRSRNSIEK